ncbi:MAG: ABC transporter ATP-binding protein, partial [Alphaproteobacteria bacterium]
MPGSDSDITFRDVWLRYGTVPALRGVSFDIRAGRLTALLGRNGAGKTSAVRLALGLRRPDAGTVRVLGATPGSLAARRRVGAVLQETALPETLRVRELLRLFAAYHARPRSFDALVAVSGLADCLAQRYGRLSGGQKRRLQVALALAGDPRVLLLDEPTTGLDVNARRGVWEGIRALVAEGKTILLTTHYLEEADRLADHVLVLDEGQLRFSGSPAEMKSRAAAARIRCRSTLEHAVLAALPAVTAVAVEGGLFEVTSTAPEMTLRALLAADPH